MNTCSTLAHAVNTVCPDLPPNGFESLEEDYALDYDCYHPTKHSMIDQVIMGDLNDAGSYPHWAMVEKSN